MAAAWKTKRLLWPRMVNKRAVTPSCRVYQIPIRFRLPPKGSVEIQTIGAGSLNQAIKGIAIARGFVAPSGDNLVVIPAFSDIVINGEDKTAMKLIVTKK